MFQPTFQEPVLSTLEFNAEETSTWVERTREKAPRAAAWFLQKEEDTERKLRGDLTSTGKCVQGRLGEEPLFAALHLPSARSVVTHRKLYSGARSVMEGELLVSTTLPRLGTANCRATVFSGPSFQS